MNFLIKRDTKRPHKNHKLSQKFFFWLSFKYIQSLNLLVYVNFKKSEIEIKIISYEKKE